MNTSSNGLAFLTREEGAVLHVYRDVVGIPTVGVGHVVLPTDGLNVGDHITQEQCDTFLAADVGKCETAINALGVDLTQNQFDALVSLIFNIGVGAFRSSTVRRDVLAGDFDGAAEAFLLWDKVMHAGTKVVNEGLLARRKREAALFSTPDGDQ